MKRRALHILVLVLAGAMLNVLVAWACALWSPLPTPLKMRSTEGASWPVDVPAHWPSTASHFSNVANGVSADGYAVHRRLERGSEHFLVFRVGFGLPGTALEFDYWMEGTTPSWTARTAGHPPTSVWRSGVEVPAWARGSGDWHHRLPLRPRVAGCAINTATYTTLLAAITFGRTAARRALRGMRGQCRACGYSLSGLTAAICPECGADPNKQADP